MTKFVGFGNFEFLFRRQTFWNVVFQACLFAITAVIFKAMIGFVVAHFVHNIPAKGQRKWRGMLLVPWVIPPAMSTLAWLWLFDPSYSAFNWIFHSVRVRLDLVAGRDRVGTLLGDPGQHLGRRAVFHDHVPGRAEIRARAALRGRLDRRRRLVAALWYVTLPMMRNIIAITALFSTIVTFANFDIVRILTSGGPLDLDAPVRD